MTKNIIIAIDGPAGSGKSSTAKLVAKKLGFVHIDTGAMYRAITKLAMDKNIPAVYSPSIDKILQNIEFNYVNLDNKLLLTLNGKIVGNEIRTQKVSNNVSAFCTISAIREKMVEFQREVAIKNSIVMEGRDIGTVVFPNADYKFFITASIKVRAQRRMLELKEKGNSYDIITLENEIANRDKMDSERKISPLKKAEDAIEVDTTDLTLEEQSIFIVNKINI